MTIIILKDLITGSEKCDENLTQNLHATIVEDRKAREKQQEEKLNKEGREEKLRLEQLRLEEQKRQDELAERKRKDELELEKLKIQMQSKLGAGTSEASDTKFLIKEVSNFYIRST
ncbi:hypothetical protein HNY73_017621 [Argiope bruennichi]|uniref:Uncharacterized protein n=1 Tax=Argiope bruennichi TaxID=94029 RepID=A0A8T0EBB2_ARGBR|nr:hypothetical protein HNY73_017621 [Argiope bruennichi]